MWNFGSLLGILVVRQITTGLIITIYYENSLDSFQSIWNLHLEILRGAIFHFLHINFASWIFLFLYAHLAKAIIFTSFSHIKVVWIRGFTLLLLIIIIAFIGYVLPWGQIRLWGATVICNLLTTIPYLGDLLVQWIWGGFFVSNITLKLFFSLHFLIPIILGVIIIFHIILLHLEGSSNPIGRSNNLIKQEFINSFLIKDLLNLIIIIVIIIIRFKAPYLTRDSENFIIANPMISPIHIQPEWYFLSYYAILRAIPNKVGGVFCFLISIAQLLIIILIKNYQSFQIFKFWIFYYTLFFIILSILIFLGGCPVETPYLLLSQVFSLGYFMWFILIFI